MKPVDELADRFLQACKSRGLRVATAESCTGGLIIASLTDIPGSSVAVDRGFITYSNEAKIDMLGVSVATIDVYGAVSGETAREMADGALLRSRAAIAIAVTGVAGPEGGSDEKPVGLVWFGVARVGHDTLVEHRQFQNLGRQFVREQAVITALQLALNLLDDQPVL